MSVQSSECKARRTYVYICNYTRRTTRTAVRVRSQNLSLIFTLFFLWATFRAPSRPSLPDDLPFPVLCPNIACTAVYILHFICMMYPALGRFSHHPKLPAPVDVSFVELCWWNGIGVPADRARVAGGIDLPQRTTVSSTPSIAAV